LEYANEVSLRQRLRELTQPFESLFSGSTNTLINDAVTTRNYLIHYDDSLKSKACAGPQLWGLCQKLEALFQLQLLGLLGLGPSEITKLTNGQSQIVAKLAGALTAALTLE